LRIGCRTAAQWSSETLRKRLLFVAVQHSYPPSLVAGAREMTSLFQILMMVLQVAQFIIIVHIILSWLINFQVLNLRQPLVAQIWDGINRLLEPIYSRIRSFLPQNLGLDLAPLVAILVIFALRTILTNNAEYFF
jgi:YggT family protein